MASYTPAKCSHVDRSCNRTYYFNFPSMPCPFSLGKVIQYGTNTFIQPTLWSTFNLRTKICILICFSLAFKILKVSFPVLFLTTLPHPLSIQLSLLFLWPLTYKPISIFRPFLILCPMISFLNGCLLLSASLNFAHHSKPSSGSFLSEAFTDC